MANIAWIGNSINTAQIDTLTVGGTVESTDIFICTINTKALSVVAGATDVDTVAATIATAWNSSIEPEFAELTAAATGAGGILTITADTSGKPFTVTATTTETGGGAADAQTFVRAASTANKGKNVVNDADNWEGGVLPGGSDTVYVENSDIDMLYELDHFAAVAFTAFTIDRSFTGTIGLPERAGSGSLTYNEYRPTHFELAATVLKIGEGTGNGSGRLKFNFATTQLTGTVFNTGARTEPGVPSVQIKTTHASSAVTVHGGDVGIAPLTGDLSTIALTQRGGNVILGSGVTTKVIDNVGGTLVAEGVTMTAAALTLK